MTDTTQAIRAALATYVYDTSGDIKDIGAIVISRASLQALLGELDAKDAVIRKVSSELKWYNPKADEYKGEHIHKVWARELDAAIKVEGSLTVQEGVKLAAEWLEIKGEKK